VETSARLEASQACRAETRPRKSMASPTYALSHKPADLQIPKWDACECGRRPRLHASCFAAPQVQCQFTMTSWQWISRRLITNEIRDTARIKNISICSIGGIDPCSLRSHQSDLASTHWRSCVAKPDWVNLKQLAQSKAHILNCPRVDECRLVAAYGSQENG